MLAGGGPISAEINFGPKMSEKHFFIVAGEQLSGVAFVKMAQARPFQFIHIELVGYLTLKHMHDTSPDPKAKRKVAVEKTLISERVVSRSGYSYKAQYGNDKTRQLSVNFNFQVAEDAPSSFIWKSNESKLPHAECSGEVRYEVFMWLDEKGTGRLPNMLPDASLCTANRLSVSVFPQAISNIVQGPKGSGKPLNLASEGSVTHKAISVTLRVVDPVAILGSRIDVAVSIDNRSKKTVEGLLFSLDEVTTVYLGPKEPYVYRKNILRDRPAAPVFVDKNSTGSVKHSFDLAIPRGYDGGIDNNAVDSPWLQIRYELQVSATVKGMKEKDLTAVVPSIFVWTQPPEKKAKEYKL